MWKTMAAKKDNQEGINQGRNQVIEKNPEKIKTIKKNEAEVEMEKNPTANIEA